MLALVALHHVAAPARDEASQRTRHATQLHLERVRVRGHHLNATTARQIRGDQRGGAVRRSTDDVQLQLYGSSAQARGCTKGVGHAIHSSSCKWKPVNIPMEMHGEVIADLVGFTGMTQAEVLHRVQRKHVSVNHEMEHAYFDPQSGSELGWWYRASATYLFGNAIHVPPRLVETLTADDGPVLDFSGGVGSNVLALARRGIKAAYTGIGLLEFQFARYRVQRHGLESMVQFVEPFSASWKLDPLAALALPASYGTIIAFDVLEHIPEYQHTVAAMVKALRPGGHICEHSPFDKPDGEAGPESGKADVRIHQLRGGVSMEEAMGPELQLQPPRPTLSGKAPGPGRCWKKMGNT